MGDVQATMKVRLITSVIVTSMLGLVGLHLAFSPASARERCSTMTFRGVTHSVCRVPIDSAELKLFLRDNSGKAYGQFAPLERALKAQGLELVFATNGGMYHRDKSPVGLYIENSETLKRANTNPGPGNFHMLPNGVFWWGEGEAGVAETKAFLASGVEPVFATQSGPMLVIDGKLHHRFIEGSTSRKYRNGVGICGSGKEIIFAISNAPVNFWDFAHLFRDGLECPNALYLDGTISSLFAPEIGRRDGFMPLGPIIGFVE